METRDGSKWDRRYAKTTTPGSPAPILTDNIHLLPAGGAALDLACGLGANSLLLARQGFVVEAWDDSAVALRQLRTFATDAGLTLQTQQIDLEQPFEWPRQYDVIVVTHYLYRPLCTRIGAALRPGGLLYYQTFNQTSRQGPSNPDYLLSPNELLELFSDLDCVVYREEGRLGDLSRGLRGLSWFIGKKPELALENPRTDLRSP